MGGVYGGRANVCGVRFGSVANLCVGQLYGQRLIFAWVTFAWWGNVCGDGDNLCVGQRLRGRANFCAGNFFAGRANVLGLSFACVTFTG